MFEIQFWFKSDLHPEWTKEFVIGKGGLTLRLNRFIAIAYLNNLIKSYPYCEFRIVNVQN